MTQQHDEPAAAADRPVTKPLDPPMVPVAVAGIGLWAFAALLILPFQRRMEEDGHGSWLWICVAGILWGIPGLLTMLRHDANRRRRRERERLATDAVDGGFVQDVSPPSA